MGKMNSIDEEILKVLSLYDHLTPLQLWYELGEDDLVKEKLTEAEIFDKLESLRARGFVETVKRAQAGGRSGYLGYRLIGTVVGKWKENLRDPDTTEEKTWSFYR